MKWTLSLCCGLLCALVPFGSAAEKKIRVTTTTSMVTDLVKSVGGDRVTVQGLMGAGVDPHLYKATAGDILKLQRAEVIFYNGLMLEGKMQDLFRQMGERKKHVFAITEGLAHDRLLSPSTFGGHPDPHVWFDVLLWRDCVDSVEKRLSEVDPAGQGIYRTNAEALKRQMNTLHEWALKRAGELAKEKRILVTSHDAFNYFGRAYGFTVVGLQGISTVTEAGIADIAKLVDFVKQHKVPAVFVESSVSHATIERISKDAGVKIGGELFSDAMGTPGQKEEGYDLGTYEGMIKHNLNTIINALK